MGVGLYISSSVISPHKKVTVHPSTRSGTNPYRSTYGYTLSVLALSPTIDQGADARIVWGTVAVPLLRRTSEQALISFHSYPTPFGPFLRRPVKISTEYPTGRFSDQLSPDYVRFVGGEQGECTKYLGSFY